MVLTLVQFALPEPFTPAQAQAVFASTAPRYRGMQGLVRKHYVLSEDGRTAGGVYLWQTRADAERVYTEDWRQFVRDKHGCEPQLTYFHAPVTVDNVVGEISVAG